LIVNYRLIIVLLIIVLWLPTRFIFQQDGVPAHSACSARNGLRANCPDLITDLPLIFLYTSYGIQEI